MDLPDARARRFERVFRAHHDAVLAYALRRSDAAAAEEVVAETFLVCWRRLDVVPDEALPWLYGVARRVLANRRRGVSRAGAALDRLVHDDPPATPRDPSDVMAEKDAILRALDALSERDREALRLWGWEGLDVAAGARAAGCSRAAFSVRVHRARRRLSAHLADADSFPANNAVTEHT
jgi:RNA polymerase sigma-70 factor, ECF subfamily